MSELLVLTYHAVEAGPPPLCVDPDLFACHLDRLVERGARTLTITEVADALTSGTLPDRAVAITFDDGCASVVRTAAPLLAERGLRATLYCVAGHLGGITDWETMPAGVPRFELAAREELADVASDDFEIGCHGMTHAPLHSVSAEVAQREIVESRQVLEEAAGVAVRSFAYPYGAPPNRAARALVERSYSSACATVMGPVVPGADRFAIPRVDAHYLRRPALLSRVVGGQGRTYLRARAVGARARRVVRRDYDAGAARGGSAS